MDPIGSFSGLASGVQWRDMIDQIMAMEKQRKLDPVTARKTAAQKEVDTWTQYQTLVAKFRDATKALRDGTAFLNFRTSGGTSLATGRAIVSATASTSAAPGTYGVEVMALARANKLSGSVVASATSALGMNGEFGVNGRKITVSAADSLAMIRDKINALNVGTSPSGVSATVLSTAAGEHRLVLTADKAGSAGIELVDDTAGTLQTLGLVDGTTSLNLSASGGVQTNRVSSTASAIAAMLGVTMPPPSTIEVGGRTISVDLTVDSLATIQAKILAAGGTATTITETAGGATGYRLVTDDTVSASTADGLRTLEVLGFTRSGRSGVAQVVRSENTYTDAGGATATATTLLTDLEVNGNPLGIGVGDTFTLQGTRGDGSAVNLSFTVGAADDLQTVVNKLNDATSGFGAGTRTATAALVGGEIVLTDNTAGDSQLGLSLSVTKALGGTISLGRQSVDTVGRLREVVAGSDASLRVDGVVVSRSTNVVDDVIAGVSLNLQQAEVGTTVAVTVDRDVDAIEKAVKDVATAYNELLKFRDAQAKPDAVLHGSSTLRSSLQGITSTFLTSVAGTSGSYTRSALAGLSLQKDGTLALDSAMFRNALATNFNEIVKLFSTNGEATTSNVSYFGSTAKTTPGTYAVDITSAATTPSASGIGFGGTYADDATGDTMTVVDSTSGATANITLSNGDTIDTIVTKLNTAFGTNKMAVTASKNGNDLVLTGSTYGTSSTLTVSYTAGGADGSAQLGLGASTYAGTNVAGTIGGLVALGNGQLLTGASGGATDGLSVRYTGTTTGAMGSVSFIQGLAAGLYYTSDTVAALGGTIASQQDTLNRSITNLQTRADTIQQQLQRRRELLVKQFVQMESALSRIQQQGSAFSSFLTQMQSQSQS